MREISLCIPTWNRYELLFEAFDKVKDSDCIREIVIVDDYSNDDIYRKVEEKAKDNPKIKLFRNERNVDCYFNKYRAISLATSKWCILLDSDNVIDFDYLYRLYQLMDWNEDTIYAPDFAMPAFCYEQFSGLEINRHNVRLFMDEPLFEVALNTCNFFVNRNSYMKVWDGSVDPVTSDSIYFNLKWLESGRKIKIVDNLRYHHRIHAHSHYNANKDRTAPGFHESILNRLKQLA